MAVAQGDGGAPIEHPAELGERGQRWPETALPFRQDLEAWVKGLQAPNRRWGKGGTAPEAATPSFRCQ